jgi:hypothetical protein
MVLGVKSITALPPPMQSCFITAAMHPSLLSCVLPGGSSLKSLPRWTWSLVQSRLQLLAHDDALLG